MNLCSEEIIKYYPAFRRIIPDSRVRSYALLPRSPCSLRSIRLACLIHVASVHPELGSNSKKRITRVKQKKISFLSFVFLTYNFVLLHVFTLCGAQLRDAISTNVSPIIRTRVHKSSKPCGRKNTPNIGYFTENQESSRRILLMVRRKIPFGTASLVFISKIERMHFIPCLTLSFLPSFLVLVA